MTFAWYGHLKYGHAWPLWKAILVSWAIALFEYCLAVPANRLGYGHFSGFQLKIIQEVVTILVFMVFAITFLKEKLAWNYLVAFVFLGVAAFFAFAFKAPRTGCLNGRHAASQPGTLEKPGGTSASQPGRPRKTMVYPTEAAVFHSYPCQRAGISTLSKNRAAAQPHSSTKNDGLPHGKRFFIRNHR